MDWVLKSPQIHNSFSNLGYAHENGYHVNENCNDTLESILHNILTEDKYLRTYRRSISFGQNIQKDLIPLLINTNDDKTVELLMKIMVNLTIPVECLLSIEMIGNNEIGRHAMFEINNLLTATKIALTEQHVVKVIVDFLKKNTEPEQNPDKLTKKERSNISNTLLFIRNVLHIPEIPNCLSSPPQSVQNQLLWNLFSQNIDKVLIKLMTIPDAIYWSVTMVQLVALIYKDQHASTLHKLLNQWLESGVSDSSEDNESNTSPPNRGSEDSSPLVTSDPTSDSSDTGASGKVNDQTNSDNNNSWNNSSGDNSDSANQIFPPQNNTDKASNDKCETSESNNTAVDNPKTSQEKKDYEKEQNTKKEVKKDKKVAVSETSDCGYGTQIDNQGAISTSSNEDEVPSQKPVHQKPHSPKQRTSNKVRTCLNLQERKRKKLVKRSKTNIINAQGLAHATPTNDDISNVLREFTVDFLLKGYQALVETLHAQILSNVQLEIDTSHFFWLVTYFLKFATQIELDLEHIFSVLSPDIISYITAEGVNLCEQLELSFKLDGTDLKPKIRRLHLVVTAIREFVQAIEGYKKSTQICNDDKKMLVKLQIRMCETTEIRSLILLLLRYYNPKYHSKQYLQDLLVTNHILLVFLDSAMKWPEYKGSGTMLEHIKQFASPEVMYQYGLLLEDYERNGEFVNDCIFTMMHHIGGDVGSLISLFQPSILRSFTSIWKSEFEICDDWTDLVEYVINTFVKKPHKLRSSSQLPLSIEMFNNGEILKEILGSSGETDIPMEVMNSTSSVCAESVIRWTDEEISLLSWNYMQSNVSTDIVGDIIKLFKEDGIYKSRDSVVKELYNQFIINKDEFDKLLSMETDSMNDELRGKGSCMSIDSKETREDEIGKLCEQLRQDGKFKFLDWVQGVLLDTCAAKIYLEKRTRERLMNASKIDGCEKLFEARKYDDNMPVTSPVSYHCILFNQSIPLVPWNCHQAAICKDLKFLQLLNKLGFHMPVDSGKVFIRIPHFWTRDFLYEVAAKISPIDIAKLKFSLDDISPSSIMEPSQIDNIILPELTKTAGLSPIPDNLYCKKTNPFASMANFTPTPGISFASSDGESAEPTWLDVVKKSQEYKITLDVEKTILEEDSEPAISSKPESSSIPLKMAHGPVLVLPTIMTVKQEFKIINLAEAEYCCNTSVCDTASVASDLTRMYVSDEDDKPPRVRPMPMSPVHDCYDAASDAACYDTASDAACYDAASDAACYDTASDAACYDAASDVACYDGTSDTASDVTSYGVTAEKRPRRHLLPPF